MKNFKFKYESVKSIKETKEKKIKKDISIIDASINRMQAELTEIEDQKRKHIEVKASKKSIKANEAKFLKDYDNYLTDMIDKKQDAINDEIEKKEKKLAELVEQSKETKILEKLKEKHALKFIKEQDRNEQLETDDIATKKYIKEKMK